MTTAQLLALCWRLSGLPKVNEEIDAAGWYELLTLGQSHWFLQLAAHAGASQYGPPVKLETEDGGATYLFPAEPYGRAEVRESRAGRVLIPGSDWDANADMVLEGARLRFPNGATRSFPDGPWARFAPAPGKIDADTEPTLRPNEARPLIAYHALELWATGSPHRDPAAFQALQQGLAWGDPRNPGAVGIVASLKVQHQHQAGAIGAPPTHWTRSPDLGAHLP